MDNKEFVKLINVSSRIDADILVSQLRVAGIETMIKTPGAGDYLNILGYGSALGQDIYVTCEDYEIAMGIVKDFRTSDYKRPERLKRIQQIFAIIILLNLVAGIVMSILF